MTESSGQQDTNDVPAAAYVCSPEDGHHWVSQLSEERIWVQTCSLCSRQSVDLEEHDAKVRAEEREKADLRLRMRIHEINDQVKNAVAAGQGMIRDDLRAKVKALPHGLARNGAVCAFVYFEGQQPCNCHRATFLALLPEEAASDVTAELLDDYDPVPGLVARGVMSGEPPDEDSLEDLHAKVKALMEYHTFAADGSLDGADLVLRSDVLALFAREDT